MMRLRILLILPTVLAAAEVGELSVANHTGVDWRQEPVSVDLELVPARPVTGIGVPGVRSQVEVLDGTETMASRIRVWALIDVGPRALVRLPVRDDVPPGATTSVAATITAAPARAGVPMAVADNGCIQVRLPAVDAGVARGTWHPPAPLPAWQVPGPAVPVAAGWDPDDWLDHRSRITAIGWQAASGPVYLRWRLDYHSDAGRIWNVDCRLVHGQRFVHLVEDGGLGDDARWIIDLGTAMARYHQATDAAGGGFNTWRALADRPGDGADFITEPGSTCLARLMIWSQFNYLRGKQEALGVQPADPALPVVGAFLVRPDRWTRAKVNHVALWERPQVGADRRSRGVDGLDGARLRLAFEATLGAQHREWALYAVASSDPAKDPWFCRPHLRHGIWPLDRLNRLPVTWGGHGPCTPTAPGPFAGDLAAVLQSTRGRYGLQWFNGSNPSMRGGYDKAAAKVVAAIPAGPGLRSASALHAAGKLSAVMAEPALATFMAMDDSAYPGERAMLPWSEAEALNPTWQGMENMNFNTDRFRSVLAAGEALEALDCPWASEVFADVRREFEGQLDRYIYPDSGLWEESHTYAGSILRACQEVGVALGHRSGRAYERDQRVQRAHTIWPRMLSPRDRDFRNLRVIPPIGDHGGPTLGEHAVRLLAAAERFAACGDATAAQVAGELSWYARETGAATAAAIAPIAPTLASGWVQGFGSVLRSGIGSPDESAIYLRAGMSWGHHHMDKGSLWAWLRGVHWLGDAAWGGPPGEHYGNPYKQGPAGHTTLEVIGVNNWPLPCRYATPWIADEASAAGADFALARCRYPYNPVPDPLHGTAPALVNGFDRLVLFIHPDILIVRDAVESPCPTVWRAHSLQGPATTVRGSRAILPSRHGLAADLAIVHPPAVELTRIDRHALDMDGKPGSAPDQPFGEESTKKDGLDTRTIGLEWRMPLGSSATWVLAARDADQPALAAEVLDQDGHVLRLRHGDGRVVTAILSDRPITWSGDGIEVTGQVAAVVRGPAGTMLHRLRCERVHAR